MSSIEQADKNFATTQHIDENDIVFYDVRKEPFKIYGLYDPKSGNIFKRLPDEVGTEVSKSVNWIYKHTAGGRVRFCTDSWRIAIRCHMPNVGLMSHMPLLGSSGFDLYEDSPTGSRSIYRGSFIPPKDMTNGYEAEIVFSERRMRYFTINFPLYNNVSSLDVGIQCDAFLGAGLEYRNSSPVVYYGSSITQGGCASRPGNSYQNFISARMGLDYVNLGFSGGCCAEKLMIEYLASIDMCAFVCDYDHNSPNPDHLRQTHLPLYKAIRATHSKIPYIIMSRPDVHKNCNREDSALRRDAIIDTYRYARSNGDDNVYYIDGEGIFKGEYEDACTVDGVHPNDIGFMFMADTLCCTFERIMADGKWIDNSIF